MKHWTKEFWTYLAIGLLLGILVMCATSCRSVKRTSTRADSTVVRSTKADETYERQTVREYGTYAPAATLTGNYTPPASPLVFVRPDVTADVLPAPGPPQTRKERRKAKRQGKVGKPPQMPYPAQSDPVAFTPPVLLRETITERGTKTATVNETKQVRTSAKVSEKDYTQFIEVLKIQFAFLIVVLLIAALIWFFVRRKRKDPG